MLFTNHTMQRMRASRLAQLQFERHWRLARTADGDRWATMRIAVFLFSLIAVGVLASSILPSVDLSAAVFTGRVLSTQKVKVVGKDDDSRWELWRAEVRLQTVVTQDVKLAERVFVYYPQDWYTNYVTTDGSHAMRGVTSGCPGRPRVATNRVYKFFCVRKGVEGEERLLFIPERLWLIPQ